MILQTNLYYLIFFSFSILALVSSSGVGGFHLMKSAAPSIFVLRKRDECLLCIIRTQLYPESWLWIAGFRNSFLFL